METGRITEFEKPNGRVELESLIAQLSELKRDLEASQAAAAASLSGVEETHRKGAVNLTHYIALRHRDIRDLQSELAELGLSSLGRAEAHVMATLDAVLAILFRLTGRSAQSRRASPDFAEGNRLLEGHTRRLLGAPPHNRNVRIMVTIPSEAAIDYALVRELVARGMDCMRINCAYDDQNAWRRMIDHLTRARAETGRPCRIEMDLAGPKLRLSAVEPGPQTIKVRPVRDLFGKVLSPAQITLVAESAQRPFIVPTDAELEVPIVEAAMLGSLTVGETLRLKDARGATREFVVRNQANGRAIVECDRTTYLASGIELRRRHADNAALHIGTLPARDQPIVLKVGDTLLLSRLPRLGRSAVLDATGRVKEHATTSCNMPEILEDVRPGEQIWFDDGKIGGVIKSAGSAEVAIEITQAAIGGSKLRGNKGINLPDSNIKASALTRKDLDDLAFIARHADIVGMSFVRTPRDVEQLQAELIRLGRHDLGIMLKIETRIAFENLPELLLAAMHHRTIGVMIARGDLAVECGYERLAEVQEEILWVCEAAHVPVVWATQVLEGLAKRGQPSRAEITDAAMGERAECVMLNKGPHLPQAVAALDDILQRMQAHQIKKSSMLRRLRW